MRILVIGDANADLTARLSRFPAEGDDSPMTDLAWGSGGSATNTAAGLALLGTPTRLLARVGRDPAARVALAVARRAGVDCGWVQEDPQISTGLCYAAISPGGERTFFSFRGANIALALPPPEILHDCVWLHIAGHALLEGEQRCTTLQMLESAIRHDVPVSLDLCLPTLRAHHATLPEVFAALSILFANEREIGVLAGTEEPLAALRMVQSLLPPTTIVKHGAQGCLVADAVGIAHVPALPVDAVDTNGCGDAFVAAFLDARLRDEPTLRCAQRGNLAGAIAATRPGAAKALPTAAELVRYEEHR